MNNKVVNMSITSRQRSNRSGFPSSPCLARGPNSASFSQWLLPPATTLPQPSPIWCPPPIMPGEKGFLLSHQGRAQIKPSNPSFKCLGCYKPRSCLLLSLHPLFPQLSSSYPPPAFPGPILRAGCPGGKLQGGSERVIS